MRWLLLLLLLAVGCSTSRWRSITPDQIDEEQVLVVTDKHAYAMTARHVDGRVEGRPSNAWNTNECELDDVNASPAEMAELCAWTPFAPPRGIRIDDAAIVDVHAERVDGRRVAIVVGVLAGVVAVTLGVGYFYAITHAQTH